MMKKALLALAILFANFFPTGLFANLPVQVCGCDHSTAPYHSMSITYATASGTACATPSAGAAYYEIVVDGEVLTSGYMDNQEAADTCTLNDIWDVIGPIIGGLA